MARNLARKRIRMWRKKWEQTNNQRLVHPQAQSTGRVKDAKEVLASRQGHRLASSIIISVGLGILLLGPTAIAAHESDYATPGRATRDQSLNCR
ncbi:uncharacterized protein BO88DRAFT_129811 [Aspergillus vadensis CBS 113365]|uniref:Uncharacterized protein n=1 Tax=Aspergillus vadensis (strain CBS 113365 / IMI 142717 / IBT 24658) TaxID=1448311 RepID=A0A319B0J8_ASPVC|nr:hypothetical protein BO88DRAFT_129811 [Aspergillus vadensis CBS 113365]PYH65999.1 hypothetical protein BO88DRAFT_129811 [Aspergillus vadensis CBS 113365]